MVYTILEFIYIGSTENLIIYNYSVKYGHMSALVNRHIDTHPHSDTHPQTDTQPQSDTPPHSDTE